MADLNLERNESPSFYLCSFHNDANHVWAINAKETGKAIKCNFDGPPPEPFKTWNEYLNFCFESKTLFGVTISANK